PLTPPATALPVSRPPTAPVVAPAPAVVAAPPKPSLPPAKTLLAAKIAPADGQSSRLLLTFDGGVDLTALKLEKTDQPPPRLVLKIPDMAKHHLHSKMALRDRRIKQLRIGVHHNPDTIHLVLDLKRDFIGELVAGGDGRTVAIKVY